MRPGYQEFAGPMYIRCVSPDDQFEDLKLKILNSRVDVIIVKGAARSKEKAGAL